MPRAKAVIQDKGIVDEPLPSMPQDPPPVVKRPPGRPKGAKTRTPATRIGMRDSGGRAMSKAAAKAKVATELYGVASMFIGLWEMRDPQCAAPWLEEVNLPTGSQERLAAVVEKVVDIFARNDAVLNAMATTGLVGEIAMLGSLMWPALRAAWQHHGPGATGHERVAEVENYADRYPAPALA